MNRGNQPQVTDQLQVESQKQAVDGQEFRKTYRSFYGNPFNVPETSDQGDFWA